MASINIGTNAVFSGHLESVLFVVGTSSQIEPCNKHNAQCQLVVAPNHKNNIMAIDLTFTKHSINYYSV